MSASVPFAPRVHVSLSRLAGTFALIGATSFGGGLTGFIRRELVTRRRWLDADEFLRGFSIAQAVPGPNAINLAIFIGWRQRGVAGALVATASVLVVPLAAVSAIAAGWAVWMGSAGPGSILRALGAFGVGLMAATAASMFRAARLSAVDLLLAATAFVGVGVLRWPVPAVLAALVALSLPVRRGDAREGTSGAP
jgi:chromate transporter